MKILVLSDSHASLRFMRQCVEAVKPDMLLHLGDYYDDAQALQEEYPNVNMQQVPGNCDAYRCFGKPELLCMDVFGVRMFMTHGHRQHVKQTQVRLLKEAREMGASIALYGHTHVADVHREEDGLWVMNPGACGSYGGSVGLIEVENGQILRCSILSADELTVLKEQR
jgi:putative phosphoesterase